jgi:hypothetical protein
MVLINAGFTAEGVQELAMRVEIGGALNGPRNYYWGRGGGLCF